MKGRAAAGRGSGRAAGSENKTSCVRDSSETEAVQAEHQLAERGGSGAGGATQCGYELELSREENLDGRLFFFPF